MDRLKSNPYFVKYEKKLLTMEREDPKKFKAILDKLTNETEQKAEEPASAEEWSVKRKMQAKEQKEATEVDKKRTGLDAIVNVEKLRKLSKEDISDLWVKYYADKDAVCATIPPQSYMAIRTILERFPYFLYPIPRNDGFEMFFAQYADDCIHFTALHQWQRLKEFAPVQLRLTHYREFEEDKDLVLMSGMIADEGLSVSDAQMLSYLVQYFALSHSHLLREFNENPGKMDHQRIISALDASQMLQK